MTTPFKALAIIPARGMSRRLPLKNMTPLRGHPLMWYSIESAIAAGDCLAKIVVSTDDAEVACYCGLHYDNIQLIERPSELARADTPMLPVIQHALDTYQRSRGSAPVNAVVVLQPTSPLRTGVDIQLALSWFVEKNAESVISITYAEEGDFFDLGFGKRMRRIKSTEVVGRIVKPNGAIFATRTENIVRGITWDFAEPIFGYEMEKDRSIDIDNQSDLAQARAVLDRMAMEKAHELMETVRPFGAVST